MHSVAKSGAYDPGGHAEQLVGPTAVEDTEPAAHGVQYAAPDPLYVPSGHEVHTSAPAALV